VNLDGLTIAHVNVGAKVNGSKRIGACRSNAKSFGKRKHRGFLVSHGIISGVVGGFLG